MFESASSATTRRVLRSPSGRSHGGKHPAAGGVRPPAGPRTERTTISTADSPSVSSALRRLHHLGPFLPPLVERLLPLGRRHNEQATRHRCRPLVGARRAVRNSALDERSFAAADRSSSAHESTGMKRETCESVLATVRAYRHRRVRPASGPEAWACRPVRADLRSLHAKAVWCQIEHHDQHKRDPDELDPSETSASEVVFWWQLSRHAVTLGRGANGRLTASARGMSWSSQERRRHQVRFAILGA